MKVPYDDVEYYDYSKLYGILTAICFIIILICYSTGIVTKFVKSLVIINIGMYSILAVKAYLEIADQHRYFDWTYAGLFVIAAVWYFLKPTQPKEP